MRKRIRGKEVKGKKTKDKPKCTIYIFCEGQTERIYLEHFENEIYNVSVVAVDAKHTDAVGIVKFAKTYVDRINLDLELGDRGYCVFDSDPASNPDIKEAFAMLKDYDHKGLYCIFSNPSFEVWFALHFGNAPYGLSANKMKKYVKTLVKDKYPNYSETVDIYDYLLDRQEDAWKRALLLHHAQEQVHETVYSHQCNPYTDIFLFLEYMKKIKEKNNSG